MLKCVCNNNNINIGAQSPGEFAPSPLIGSNEKDEVSTIAGSARTFFIGLAFAYFLTFLWVWVLLLDFTINHML